MDNNEFEKEVVSGTEVTSETPDTAVNAPKEAAAVKASEVKPEEAAKPEKKKSARQLKKEEKERRIPGRTDRLLCGTRRKVQERKAEIRRHVLVADCGGSWHRHKGCKEQLRTGRLQDDWRKGEEDERHRAFPEVRHLVQDGRPHGKGRKDRGHEALPPRP